MRIITLLARHGTAKYGDAVAEVAAVFSRQMPGVAHDMLVVDNALPEDHREGLGMARTLIGAPNSHWEFSAWDRGISHLGACLDRYDLVHLATSAFQTLHTRYLDHFDADMLGSIRGRAAAVGHIDYFNEAVTIGDRSLRSWLRSSFIILPPAQLRLVGSLVSVGDRTPFFSGDPDRPFREDAPLSKNYQRYIIDWLTGPGTGQGVQWHSRFDLNRETLGLFEAKTMAILNEQMMSARLRVLGCHLLDATWLASRSGRQAAKDNLDAIPDWLGQVAQRDSDAPSRRWTNRLLSRVGSSRRRRAAAAKI